jgi:hypothetical protein
MILPTVCNMPDLRSECPPLLPRHILFFKDPDQQFRLIRTVIVHWLDEAVREFNEARNILLAQISEMKRPPNEMEKTGRILYSFEFAHRIDHCLILTRRLLRALDQLKGMPRAQIDRQTRKFIDAQGRELVDARNVIEHLPEFALSSKWPNHGSLFPRLTGDQLGIEVGGKVVTFAQLANTLRRFHAIAQQLVDTQSWPEYDEQA